MTWDNLFGQETITYGFDKFTQDDFCTAIILLLAAILLVNIFILSNVVIKGQEIDKISDELTKMQNENNNLKDLF